MDPGNPGSIDEARDGDFLNSAVSINDAKRRRLESGILALTGNREFSSAAGGLFLNRPSYQQYRKSETSAPLTAAAPSATVSSLSRGAVSPSTSTPRIRELASLQEELLALQKEAARRGVLVLPTSSSPAEAHHGESDRLLAASHLSLANSMAQSQQDQLMILQALEQQQQQEQREPHQIVPHGSALQQGRNQFTLQTASILAESSHDVRVVPSSSYMPQQGNDVLINSDAFGVSGFMDLKTPAQFSGGRTEAMLHDRHKARKTSGSPDSAPNKGTTLYMKCDIDNLSDYQCLVRKNIEIFVAGASELDSTAKGRNKPIMHGQVGIRCLHCAWLDPRERKKGAMYYPAKLSGIYQAAQSLASSHLCNHCEHVPQDIRKQLHILKERKSSAGGGKDYWSDSARIIGVCEDPERGLYYKSRKG